MDQRAQAQSRDNGLRDSVADSISRGKEAVSTAASNAMDAAGVDLKALRSDLSDLKDTVAKFASRASDEPPTRLVKSQDK
jgi:hypothetical protein